MTQTHPHTHAHGGPETQPHTVFPGSEYVYVHDEMLQPLASREGGNHVCVCVCVQVALKIADLGHLAEDEDVHRMWVSRLEGK